MAPVAAPKASMLRHATSTSARRFGSTASTSDDGGSPGAREAARGARGGEPAARRRGEGSNERPRGGRSRRARGERRDASVHGNATVDEREGRAGTGRGGRDARAKRERHAGRRRENARGHARVARLPKTRPRGQARARRVARARVGVRVSSSLSETTSARIDSLAPHVNDQFFGAHLHTLSRCGPLSQGSCSSRSSRRSPPGRSPTGTTPPRPPRVAPARASGTPNLSSSTGPRPRQTVSARQDDGRPRATRPLSPPSATRTTPWRRACPRRASPRASSSPKTRGQPSLAPTAMTGETPGRPPSTTRPTTRSPPPSRARATETPARSFPLRRRR